MEMVHALKDVNTNQFGPREYVVASGDEMSVLKLNDLEVASFVSWFLMFYYYSMA